MDEPRLRVGRAITPEQFELLSDEQLVRLLPRSVREFFPGKDFCADSTCTTARCGASTRPASSTSERLP
jgi:hypothetical protein